MEISGKRAGIYKDNDGTIYAVKPVCTHMGCAIKWNKDENTLGLHLPRFPVRLSRQCDWRPGAETFRAIANNVGLTTAANSFKRLYFAVVFLVSGKNNVCEHTRACFETHCHAISAHLHPSFSTKMLVNTQSIACAFYEKLQANLRHAAATSSFKTRSRVCLQVQSHPS